MWKRKILFEMPTWSGLQRFLKIQAKMMPKEKSLCKEGGARKRSDGLLEQVG